MSTGGRPVLGRISKRFNRYFACSLSRRPCRPPASQELRSAMASSAGSKLPTAHSQHQGLTWPRAVKVSSSQSRDRGTTRPKRCVRACGRAQSQACCSACDWRLDAVKTKATGGRRESYQSRQPLRAPASPFPPSGEKASGAVEQKKGRQKGGERDYVSLNPFPRRGLPR